MPGLNGLNGTCAHCQTSIELGDEQLSAIACNLNFRCGRCQGILTVECPTQLHRLRTLRGSERQLMAGLLVGLCVIFGSYVLMRFSLVPLSLHMLVSYLAIITVVAGITRWKLGQRTALVLQVGLSPRLWARSAAPLHTQRGRRRS